MWMVGYIQFVIASNVCFANVFCICFVQRI